VKNSLDESTARDVLQSVTEQAVGHPIRVMFTVGNAPVSAPSPVKTPVSEVTAAPTPVPASAPTMDKSHDALDELMDKGKELEHFLIKGE